MTIKGLLKTGGLTALATAMAVTALPSAANAAPGDHPRSSQGDRGDRGGNSGARQARDTGGDRGDRGDRGGRPSGDRGPSGGAQRGGPAPGAAPARVVNNGNGYHGDARNGGRTWAEARGGPPVPGARPAGDNRGTRPARVAEGDHRGSDRNWNGDNRNGSWYDRGRHENGSWNDRGRHENGSWNDRGRHDNHSWDRNWRSNNRYNWSAYRNSHRSIFHLGTYYSPYRNYSYRRLSIGFYLDSLFYSNRYWIDDPYNYRLPDAYGPYRWVRYYDDALLVDIYTGEVVDVMYDFFW